MSEEYHSVKINRRDGVDYGDVRWDVVVTNQDAEQVATYDVLTLVATRPSG